MYFTANVLNPESIYEICKQSMHRNFLECKFSEVNYTIVGIPDGNGDESTRTMLRIWAETSTAKIDLVKNRYEGAGPRTCSLFKIVSSFITLAPY